MQFKTDTSNHRSLDTDGLTSPTLPLVLAVGPVGPTGPTGPAGPAGPAWTAVTAYTTGDVVTAPDGSRISRNSSGTSRATFDSTEQALWTTIGAKAGTLENTALLASMTGIADARAGAGSDLWIKAIGGDYGFVFTASPTIDATTGVPVAGAVKWPDGRPGVFTGTVDSNYYTGYTVTYVPATGPTRTLTATGITFDTASGFPLGPTGLAVA